MRKRSSPSRIHPRRASQGLGGPRGSWSLQEKPPAVQLTPEEIKTFRPTETSDLPRAQPLPLMGEIRRTDHTLSSSLDLFALPEKAEGFDTVRAPFLSR